MPPASPVCLSEMLTASGGRTGISISCLAEVPDWPSLHHRALSMAYIMTSKINHLKGKTLLNTFLYISDLNIKSEIPDFFRHLPPCVIEELEVTVT